MACFRCLLKRGSLARLKPLLCLLAILQGPAQVVPGLLAIGAALEGSHSVHVGNDGAEFHLVLSHERGQTGRPDYNPRHCPQDPAHHHGLAARVLCLLAEQDGVEPDHIAIFETGSVSEKLRQAPEAEAEAGTVDAKMYRPASTVATFKAPESVSLLPGGDHGPPFDTSLLRLLRSTVLLI